MASNVHLSAVARGIIEDAARNSKMGSGIYAIFGVEAFGSGYLVKISHTFPDFRGHLVHEWRTAFVTYDRDTSTAKVVWNMIC
jgi:hypothetical protein